MKVLVSERLSEHKYKTPEGYLICTDAILARTGKQTYTKDELFGDGDSTEVNVDRPYKEVFDASTLASFENKPVTIEHPDEEVNVGNYKDYAVGYVRDVHQGKTSDGQDVILGNIVITDQQAINDIEEGKHTNLSCGYDCDILGDDDSYFQHKIRGNHVALCECPRAGITKLQDAIIKDSTIDSMLKEVIKLFVKQINSLSYEKVIRQSVSNKAGTIISKYKDKQAAEEFGADFDQQNELNIWYDNKWRVSPGSHNPVDTYSSAIELVKDYGISPSSEMMRLQKDLNETEYYSSKYKSGMPFYPDSVDEMHKYKFEYNMPFYDRKTGESGYDHRSKVVSAVNAYEASRQLPDDAEIVRIYKDDKLLKSFASKQAGQWHKSGNKEQLKGLDAVKNPTLKDFIRRRLLFLFDIGFSAKEIRGMIKKKDYRTEQEFMSYCENNMDVYYDNVDNLFKEMSDTFEKKATKIFTQRELEKMHYFDSLDVIHDAAKPSEAGINKVKEFLKPNFKIVSENMTSSGHYQMSVVSINEYNRYYYNMSFNRVYPLLSRIGSSYGMIVDPSFSLKEDKHVYGKIDIVSKNTTDSFKEEPKAWNDVKAALKNEFMLTREGKTLTDRHHMTFVSLDMYNEADFKDLSRKVYIKLKNIASKYATPITHSIGLRKNFYVVLDVDIDKQYINDSKKLLNIINVYKLAKAVSDAKVVNEEDLDFIKQAKKIQKRGNPKQLFVVRVISNDYAEGFASGDGGKTWETAKTRLVKRAGGNSRYQTERRFGAIGNLSVEIPFSHISWCHANNATVIPNETIDHKDGNHLNDDPSNLEPVSVKENSRRNAEFMKMR